MLSKEEQQHLRPFLETSLASICDADPSMLADYILALLKNDKPFNELKEICLSQLMDFLKKETKPFVEKLFSSLSSKDYLPPSSISKSETPKSSKQPSSSSSTQVKPYKHFSEEEDDDEDGDRSHKHKPKSSLSPLNQDAAAGLDRTSSKRHYADFDDGEGKKRSRIQSLGDDQSRHTKSYRPYRDYNSRDQRYPQEWKSSQGRGRPSSRKPVDSSRPRQRCRDYDEKGYCMRGDMCMFDHGMDKIVHPRPTEMIYSNQRQREQVSGSMPFVEGYDPERSAIPLNYSMPPIQLTPGAGIYDTATSFPQALPPIIPEESVVVSLTNAESGHFKAPFRPQSERGGRGRGKFVQGSLRENQRGRRAPGPYPSPFTKPSKSLLIENIPVEKTTEQEISSYFSQFGDISKVSILPPSHGISNIPQNQVGRAYLEFNSEESAKNAFNSPDAVFGNRFVRVKWWRTRQEEDTSSHSHIPSEQAIEEAKNAMEEAAAAQKLKKQEQLEKMLELQKEKEMLIQRHIEQQKQIMERMAQLAQRKPEQNVESDSKNGENMSPVEKDLLESLRRMSDSLKETGSHLLLPKSTAPSAFSTSNSTVNASSWEEKEKERLDRELDLISKQDISTSNVLNSEVSNRENQPETAASREELLKSKLELLKAEAASMGLPDQALNKSAPVSYRPFVPRYGPYNMTYRPGQAPSVRPFFPVAPNYSQFSLDNRPRRLGISIPSSSDVDVESLKKHFEVFGEVVSLIPAKEAEEYGFIVEFATRRVAEIAKVRAAKFQSGDNTLDLEMVWLPNGSGPSAGQPLKQHPAVDSNHVTNGPSKGKEEPASFSHLDDDDDEDEVERSWKR